MNAHGEEKLFLENVKALLDEGAENLGNETKQRLEHVRIKALKSAVEKRPGFFTPLRWIMVGGFATATMAAVGLFFWLHTSPEILPARNIEDFEIITSGEHIDFYQNLDFYRWLVIKENGTANEKRPNV